MTPPTEAQVEARLCVSVQPPSLPESMASPAGLGGDTASSASPTVIDGQRVPSPSRLQLTAVVGDLTILLGCYVAVIFATSRVNGASHVILWCLALTVVWLVVALNLGAYERAVIARRVQSPYMVAKVAAVAGAVFHLLPLVGGPTGPRLASIAVVLVQVTALVAWRLLLACLASAVTVPVELVIVGAGWAGRTLAEALVLERCVTLRAVAFVDDDPALVATRLDGLPVHPADDLPRLVRGPTGLRRVVLAIERESHADLYDRLTALAEAGVEIVPMASVYEEVTGRIPVRHLGNLWWASLPRPSGSLAYLAVKRAADLAGAAMGVTILAIVLPIVAPLLKRETRGSLFFTQTRIGQHGKPLRLVKLRTLPEARQSYTSLWERKNGNRPSRLGAVLRVTGIDELPQCLNVLRGEMSLVGPRPYVLEEVAEYQRRIPFFRSRALVKPGITGWAQVNWGYGLSLHDEVEKLQYDLYYVGHQSFYLDLLIVLRTWTWILKHRSAKSKAGMSAPQADAELPYQSLGDHGASSRQLPRCLPGADASSVPVTAPASAYREHQSAL